MRLISMAAVLALSACGGGSTPCGDSAFFTACVQQCGETAQTEPMAASCVFGSFRCDTPLTPASDCPAGSWTSSTLPCGPWPGTYDCGMGCAVCTSVRTWTCGSCSDGGGSD